MIFLNLPINPFFIIFFQNFFYIYIFFIYIKLSKNLSAKYYQENKERLQKKLVNDFSREEEKRKYGGERYKNLSKDKK